MNVAVYRACGVWMLCLGLMLPGVGRAAQVEPTVSPSEAREEAREVPATQDDAPRRLRVDDDQEAWEQRTGAPRGLRILGEVGGGLLTAGALGIVGGLAGSFLCNVFRPSQDGWDDLACFGFGILGAGLGVVAGGPLGVWGAGEMLGGNGSLLTTLGGGALGLVGGLIVTGVSERAASQASGSGAVLRGLATPVLALTGCVLGYELSQKAPRRWASRGGLLPLVSFTPSGTVMGLGGHF